MQQLLDEEICKVCNREAKKGSEPYLFMSEKLNELIKSEEVETEDNELFKLDTIRDLDIIKTIHDRDKKSFNGIRKEIKETMEFNDQRKLDIKQNQKRLKNFKVKLIRLLVNLDLQANQLKPSK